MLEDFGFYSNLAGDEGGLDQNDSNGGGKKLDCGFILKKELTGFTVFFTIHNQ